MGHILVRAIIRGTKGEKTLEEVTVDTGATFTVMPTKIVREVGAIKSPWAIDLLLGNRRKVKAATYLAEVELNGRKGPMRIASFEKAVPAIGVDTLETLGLKVNPLTGKLEPARGAYALYI